MSDIQVVVTEGPDAVVTVEEEPDTTVTVALSPPVEAIEVEVPGPAGPPGASFDPDQVGLLSERDAYAAEAEGFSFLAMDEGELYFKLSATSGDWSDPIPFGIGPEGPPGADGTDGVDGAAGPGLPTGGTATQVPKKVDDTDYNTAWGNVAWTEVTSKPSTFPPDAHDHDDRYFTETEADARYLQSVPGSYATDAEVTSAISAHEAAADPHTGYLKESDHTKAAHDALDIDADTLDGIDSTGFTPSSHVGSGGTAHSNAVAAGAAGFMTGTDKTKLDGIEAGATTNPTSSEIIGAFTGTPDGTKFLKDDGTLEAPAGGGGGAPSGPAGGVLSGTYPDPGFAADMATQAELDAHTGDTTDAHDASAISVADAGANFTATDVENALAEEADARQAHEADTTGAHAATAISYAGSTNLSSITVEAALDELDTEKASTGSVTTVATSVSDHLADTSDAHDASAISVADAGANYTATDVEAALAEEADARQAHEANTSNPHSVTAAQAGAVPTTRTVSTTAPLTGGGDLSANRTLAVGAASDTASGVVELATSAETTTGTDTARATTPAGVKAVSDTLTPTARTISTTAPLTGGGDLSANRTLAVSAASSTAQGVVELATDAETTTGTDTARATTPANVKAAIDVHLNDTSAAHAGSAISFSPTGTIAATDVQAAIAEVASEASGGGVAKYSANVGDGSTTNIAVTHSLGTKDITVTLRQVSDDAVYHVDWTATSTTVVTLNFTVAPTTNQFDLTVIG